MPRNTQFPAPNKKSVKRHPGNGNMAPTADIKLNGPDISPRTRYEQEFDEFDLFQSKKATAGFEAKPASSNKKVATPGATGNTPLTSQENFNMSNMVKNRPSSKPVAKTTIKQVSTNKYAVNFNIFYETQFGQEVWVLGSLKQLGEWKEYKMKLFWGENHCWGTKEPILVNEPYFEYKYALFGVDGDLEFWETGINRIADLETLPCDEALDAQNMKQIFISDVWEEYKMRFTLFDPLYEKDDQMVMCPSDESGLSTTYPMERIDGPEEWLMSKYGKPVPVWECEIPLQNANGDGEGQFLDNNQIAFTYTYAKKKRSSANLIKERMPARRFIIDNPNTYSGELADQSISSTPHFKISDSVKIVNGVVEKADGTFLYDFFFNEVIEEARKHNIVVGPCPQTNADVKKMVTEGKVTAVLSLQTEMEEDQRAVDTRQLKAMYRDQGIKTVVNLPVEDNNLEDYSEENFQACQALDKLLEQKQRVYVHCTAGMSRAQTIVITYLCLHQKSKFWFNSAKVEEIVRKNCNGCQPNHQCVQRTIQKYGHLYKTPKKVKLVDEIEKRRLDIIAQREEKNLWERREIYLKGERDRNNRIKDQENEIILQRRKLEEYERQKLIKFYYDKEMKLSAELKGFNIEEEEMIRRIKQQQIDETTQFEHYIQCNTEYAGVSDSEIDDQCQQLFIKPPIKFYLRKDIKLELYLKRLIDEHNITIPIVHIKGSLYLVGINKIHLEQKADDVIAQVGGGYQKFEPYIFKNHKIIERQLIIKMIQSKESIEWIVDALIRGEKIPTSHQTAYDSATRTTGSPTVSRIQLMKIPSSRLDKNGLIRSDVVQTRRTTMIGSSQSPTRMGLSPTRLDTYTSPIARKSSLASPTSKNSQKRTAATGKNYNESPTRGQSNKGSYHSPKNKQGERSFSPTAQTKKLIKQIETKYESKRQVVIKQLTSVESSKNEHYNARDQTVAEYNKAKYVYIHTEKSRAI